MLIGEPEGAIVVLRFRETLLPPPFVQGRNAYTGTLCSFCERNLGLRWLFARPQIAVDVWSRISRPKINQPQLFVDRWILPDWRTTMSPAMPSCMVFEPSLI